MNPISSEASQSLVPSSAKHRHSCPVRARNSFVRGTVHASQTEPRSRDGIPREDRNGPDSIKFTFTGVRSWQSASRPDGGGSRLCNRHDSSCHATQTTFAYPRTVSDLRLPNPEEKADTSWSSADWILDCTEKLGTNSPLRWRIVLRPGKLLLQS